MLDFQLLKTDPDSHARRGTLTLNHGPLLGWLDDGIVALVLFKFAQRLLPADLLAALKAKLDAKQDPSSKPL